ISYNNGTLTVNPKALTITADDQSKTYGELFSFDGSEFSPSASLFRATVASVSLSSDGAPETAAAGGHSIVASGATGPTVGNYSITYNNGTLTVNPKALTITADDQSKTYGELFSFDGSEFSAAGLVNGDTVASVSLSSDGAPETAAAGGHSIVASGATGPTVGNYSI